MNISDFYYFLKSPRYLSAQATTIKEKTLIFTILFVIVYVLSVTITIFNQLVFSIIDDNVSTKTFQQLSAKLFNDYSLFNYFYILFLGPLLEELIFRLPLKYKKINFIISFSILTLLFLGGEFYSTFYSWRTALIKTGTILCVFLFFFWIKQSLIDKVVTKYYTIFFYFLSIAFAFYHISNYDSILPDKYIWLIPLLILPQFILGIFTSYIRLKNGFWWVFFMHVFFNSPSVILSLLMLFLNKR